VKKTKPKAIVLEEKTDEENQVNETMTKESLEIQEPKDKEIKKGKSSRTLDKQEILCKEDLNVMTLENSILLIKKFEHKFLVIILSNPKRMRSYSFSIKKKDSFEFPDNINKEIFGRIMNHFILVFSMFRGSLEKSFSSDAQRALFSESFVHYIEKFFEKKYFDSIISSANPEKISSAEDISQAPSNSSKNSLAQSNAEPSSSMVSENATPNRVLPSLNNSNFAFNRSNNSRPLNLWEFSIPKIFKGKIPKKTFLMILQELLLINDNSFYDLIIFHKNDLIYYKNCKELALFFSEYLFDMWESLNQEICKQSELKKFLAFLGLQMDSHIFYDEQEDSSIPRRFSRNFEEDGDSFYRNFKSKEKGKFFQKEKGKGMSFYIPTNLYEKFYKCQKIVQNSK